MKLRQVILTISIVAITGSAFSKDKYNFVAGDPSLQVWLLPDEPPYPRDNKPNSERIALGKNLFFDPRLSRTGAISCNTCHNPALGWSDGTKQGVSIEGKKLGRASPTVVNTAYNSIQMWDGRKRDLEDQAMGPMEAKPEMNADLMNIFNWLESVPGYKKMFEAAYPGQGINSATFAKAIASFERTIISNNSPFDKWVKGDKQAMTAQQINGFKLFVNPNKGNCESCHSAPNFTDNGFHNIGLASYGEENPDLGRYKIVPIPGLKGAFKTPTVRDAELTAPYFHDGSANTLEEVMEFYAKKGEVKDNIDKGMIKIELTKKEQQDIVEFIKALTTKRAEVTIPILPH